MLPRMNGTADILVVDDSEINVDIIEARLAPKNYRVRRAYGGAETLRICDEQTPDLIILDLVMPEMDGFEVIRRLKLGEDTRAVPIIALTALQEFQDKIRAIELGASDFITKPFNSVELLTKVHALLEAKRYQDERREQAARLEKAYRELKTSQEQLVKAERLAAIGQLGIAACHEINNPLTVVLGEIELLSQTAQLPPKAAARVKRIRAHAQRVAGVVAELGNINSEATKEYVRGASMIDLHAASAG